MLGFISELNSLIFHSKEVFAVKIIVHHLPTQYWLKSAADFNQYWWADMCKYIENQLEDGL